MGCRLPGASDVEVGDVVEPTAEEIPDRRPKFMQTVPVMLRGVFRSAMKLALQEILDGTEAESHVRAT